MMKMFLKFIDEQVWAAIVNGWEPPTVIRNGVIVPKPHKDWIEDEFTATKMNSKGLNAIFSIVDTHHFEYIASCTTSKEAWHILENLYDECDAVEIQSDCCDNQVECPDIE
ncbi:hypothetical protein TorRG33x02_202320, partial [Trema orientale]